MLTHSLRRSLPLKLVPAPRKISTSALAGSSRRNPTPVTYPARNPNIYTGLLRFKSTKTVNTAAGSSSTTPTTNVAGNAPTPATLATEGTSVRRASPTPRLTWPEYLLIRKNKRKWQTVSTSDYCTEDWPNLPTFSFCSFDRCDHYSASTPPFQAQRSDFSPEQCILVVWTRIR